VSRFPGRPIEATASCSVAAAHRFGAQTVMSASRKRGTTHRPAGVSDHGSTSIHGRRGYSAFSCRRRTKGGYISGIALPNDLLIRTFRQLGYDVDQMDLEGVIPPAIRVRDVYLGLQRDAAVVARAQQLLEHPTPPLRADDRNYLAQLAAVATANPDFCAHIPADQRINQVAAPLRDWCFYTVAFDTQDIRVCDRLTPAARRSWR
jgi:hypothetical protein